MKLRGKSALLMAALMVTTLLSAPSVKRRSRSSGTPGDWAMASDGAGASCFIGPAIITTTSTKASRAPAPSSAGRGM